MIETLVIIAVIILVALLIFVLACVAAVAQAQLCDSKNCEDCTVTNCPLKNPDIT